MDNSIKARSLILSLFIHGAILFVLLFVVLQTPIPPFPEAGGGGGLLVNIGYVDLASGDIQPTSELTTQNPEVSVEEQIQSEQPEEQFIAQETEETAAIKSPEKKTEKPKINTKTETVKVEPKETPKPVEKQPDQQSLYKKKNSGSTSQGTAQTGSGDQGSKEGDPVSNYYGKNGSGSGSGGGDGGGEGGGLGPGTGTGSGPGKDYSLKDRAVLKRFKPDDTSQEEGIVVVAISVDKNGKVTNANPGVQGSTTTSTLLYNKAKQAALKWEFNKSPQGFETQKGTITFVFKNR